MENGHLALSTINVAAASFLDRGKCRDVWLSLYESSATPPMLGASHTPIPVLRRCCSEHPAIALQASTLRHPCRFLRITMHRMRDSASYTASPFTPGGLEIILETDRDTFPIPDPNGLQPITALDTVMYLYTYSKLFGDHLLLSFRIHPSMGATLIQTPPAPHGVRRTMRQNCFAQLRMYKSVRANDPAFRLRIDDTLL